MFSGSKKSKQLTGTDVNLIVIAVFCLSVVIFIGFNCCYKRGKRKDKAKQRKFGRKKGHHEQDDLLNKSRHSEESLDVRFFTFREGNGRLACSAIFRSGQVNSILK